MPPLIAKAPAKLPLPRSVPAVRVVVLVPLLMPLIVRAPFPALVRAKLPLRSQSIVMSPLPPMVVAVPRMTVERFAVAVVPVPLLKVTLGALV